MVNLDFIGIPLNKSAVEIYQINQADINDKGRLKLENFQAVMDLAKKINEKRNISIHSEKTVFAAEISGINLLVNLIENIVEYYQKQISSNLFNDINRFLAKELDDSKLVYEKYDSEYLPHWLTINRDDSLRNLITIWILNSDPALKNYNDLYSDQMIFSNNIYSVFFKKIEDFFDSRPKFNNTKKTLLEFIFEPIEKFPNSIYKQLRFVAENWKLYIDNLESLLKGIDFLKETKKMRSHGPGPTKVYSFDYQVYEEMDIERFTKDKEWMPKVVLIAKNVYVWLDQLSKKYNRNIRHLDEIPEEEFVILRRWGFSSLWLIGLWERSPISQRIKHLSGNSDSIASAYSLKKYDIAEDLGGWSSFKKFKEKAGKLGIRVASDMVPNHTGLDSEWLLKHPEWFINTDIPPFPSYTFNGVNLSDNDRYEIKIEDGYFNKTDAAVVFKFYDKYENKEFYIYHGNDGTHLPWNDTAQLNYLIKEVRETVIAKIVEIAREFDIIRFDAAMTLAKKHFQRLWFPIPGKGGDVPSRFKYGMSREEFNKFFPKEFWLEVVETVEKEVPNTLLLAEAFWMMEGYFVRNLGMHRVYNSAFMNMLKNEENNKYRQTIYRVLEYNPQILKRFVNFMSNPDEDTAIDQFGENDKYFGVCVLMTTLPGLPMFAHGQIEGLHEKYGMEYFRAKYDESPNYHLIERHKHEIFPILKRRKIFAEVDNFFLFDFHTEYHGVNGNVFAYFNEFEGEKALVFYHNKFKETCGRIKVANYPEKNDDEVNWFSCELSEMLGVENDSKQFVIATDITKNLEFIFSSKEICEKGIFIYLSAYKYHVLTDFKIVRDGEEREYEQIYNFLEGKGIDSVENERKRIKLLPLLRRFQDLIKPQVIQHILKVVEKYSQLKDLKYFREFKNRLFEFLDFYVKFIDIDESFEKTAEFIINDFVILAKIMNKKYKYLPTLSDKKDYCINAIFWVIIKRLSELSNNTPDKLLDEFLFGDEILKIAEELLPNKNSNAILNKIRVLLNYSQFWKKNQEKKDWKKTFFDLLEVEAIKNFLDINLYDNIKWYDKENFEELFSNIFFVSLISNQTDKSYKDIEKNLIDFFYCLFEIHFESEFKLEQFKQNLIEICRGKNDGK